MSSGQPSLVPGRPLAGATAPSAEAEAATAGEAPPSGAAPEDSDAALLDALDDPVAAPISVPLVEPVTEPAEEDPSGASEGAGSFRSQAANRKATVKPMPSQE